MKISLGSVLVYCLMHFIIVSGTNYHKEFKENRDIINNTQNTDQFYCEAICYKLSPFGIKTKCGHNFCLSCIYELRQMNPSVCAYCRAPLSVDLIGDYSFIKMNIKNIDNIEIEDLQNCFPILPLFPETTRSDVLKWLSKEIDINFPCPLVNGATALFFAAHSGNFDIIKILVEQGASYVNEDGISGLHFATKQNIKIVQYFLQLGVDINQNGKNGTPLLWAVHYGNVQIVEYLIMNNAKVNLETGITPLIVASAGGHFKIVQLLFEKGAALVNYNSENYGNPLFWAAGNGHLNIVNYLIEKKADVNLGTMENGSTPLMIATLQNDFGIVKTLLENKSHVNKTTLKGYTALHFASQFGYLKIVKYLIKNGANFNQNASGCGTPLIFATIGKYFDTIQWLVENTAIEVNAYSTDGYSALHWAVMKTEEGGSLEILKYLIKNGANVNINTFLIGSPLHLAALNGYLKVIKILIHHGANVNNVKEQNGFSPLHESIKGGHFEVCKYLIAHGANINAKTKNGSSTYDLASSNGHVILAEFFSQNHNF